MVFENNEASVKRLKNPPFFVIPGNGLGHGWKSAFLFIVFIDFFYIS